jgi:hypothetical protein
VHTFPIDFGAGRWVALTATPREYSQMLLLVRLRTRPMYTYAQETECGFEFDELTCDRLAEEPHKRPACMVGLHHAWAMAGLTPAYPPPGLWRKSV